MVKSFYYVSKKFAILRIEFQSAFNIENAENSSYDVAGKNDSPIRKILQIK